MLSGNSAVKLKTTHPSLFNSRGSIYFSKDKIVTLAAIAALLCIHQNLNFVEINSFWETMNCFSHVKTPDN